MPSSKVYRILSLSGGGVRGLITAVWLDRLERKLGSPIGQFFDLIAGTSTGSLIACALSMGMKAETIVKIYRDRAQEIFPNPASRLWSRLGRTFSQGLDAPRYDSRGLELVLRSVFGDARFGDLRVPTLVTSYNLASREALVFKTIPNAGSQVLADTYRKYNSFPVWEICKASSSAPVYFPAHITQIDGQSVSLIDGGVVANNPTACAIAEGVRINDARSVDQRIPLGSFVVASFGTGESNRPITSRESQEWGALEWAIPLIDVLFDGSGDAVDYIARQILPDGNYFRFQTLLDKAYDDIDRTDATNLNALIGVAQDYLNREGDALLDKLIVALKS